jgi:general secretion pathway protein N
MNAANQRRLTPVLAAIVLVLGAAFALLLGGVGRQPHWSPPRAMAPLPPPANPADLPVPLPLSHFALVWQKPLFSPDRKPVARAADGGSNLGDLQLTGVIITPGLRMALLHDKQGNRELRLHEGESLPDGSVTLVEVRSRSALFDASGGRTELKLPAGAPIDALKDPGGMDGPNGGPGNAMMPMPANTVAPTQDAPGVRRVTPSAPRAPPGEFLKKLREDTQRRRAARAAATH